MRLCTTVYLFCLILLVSSLNAKPTAVENRIDSVLSLMTLEEKIGQMNQITLEVVSKPRKPGSFINEIDPQKLRDAILKYNVGSILNTGGQANEIRNWIEMITMIQDVATKESRLGIPILYGIDAIHGANYTKDATLFPQSIAMGATFNKELVQQSAEITALEIRASGIPWNFNPVLGVARNPLWSRFWETYGESPYLVSEMGEAYVIGTEGAQNMPVGTKAAACIKHYLGYSNPHNGNDRAPAWIPERMLRDIFLPPFAKSVEAGVQSVMVNSSEINGIPVHTDYNILTELLKNELNFKGFVISDWGDVNNLHYRDQVAQTNKEAVKMAVLAGLDMSMVPFDYSFYESLLQLVKDGDVPESRIDDAVSRILRVKFNTGLFENPYPDTTLLAEFASAKSGEVNLQAASEAVTLLKNSNNILPLSKKKKILVTGPTANLLSVMNGGWTITWQGNEEKLYPAEKFTVLEAIQEKIGTENVTYFEGVDFDKDINTAKAQEAAGEADAVIVCLGEQTYCEGQGIIDNLLLPPQQLDLVSQLAKSGKPLILVLLEGRPRVIQPVLNDVSALLMGYLPGMEGGRAIADIIFGDTNPSGKLPFSYPRSPNGFVPYDHKYLERAHAVQDSTTFGFGYGLSYTTFEYSNLMVSKNKFKPSDKVEVSVDIRNTGKLSGKESVLLFGTDVYASVSRPVRELKRFTKISLDPGAQKTVTFKISASDFAFTGRDNKKTVEPGIFIISVADLKTEIELLQ